MTFKKYKIDPDSVLNCPVIAGSNIPTITNLPFYASQIGLMDQGANHFTERIDAVPIYQIMFTVSGSGIITHLGHTIELKENQICIIDFRKYHYYKTSEAGHWKYYYIMVLGPACKQYMSNLYEKGFAPITLNNPDITKNNIDEIWSLFDKYTIQCGLRISLLVYTILLTMINDKNIINSSDNIDFNALIAKIDSFIVQNIRENIKLQDIADSVHLSTRHISRKFSDNMGMTLHKYISYHKIAEAKNLLYTTSFTIDEIAELLSYPSSSGFIKHFKSVTSLTPKQYRDINKIR